MSPSAIGGHRDRPFPRHGPGRLRARIVSSPPDWRPGASLLALRLRAQLNALVRQFFADRGVLEVETPIFSRAGNTDANIESLHLQLSGPPAAAPGRRWLRTSPEFAIKRLLAAGIGDCYELGRVFRDGEAGRHHNPEFTLLEWYRIGWDHRRLMDEVSELVALAMADAGRPVSVERLSYAALYQRHCGLDPHLADDQALVAALGDIRLDATGLGRDDWLDLLMTHRIQPELPDSRLTLVYDYPAGQCALARLRPGTPPLAERFEAYLGPLELANGFHELADAQEQRVRFIADQAIRSARGRPSPPLDENLLAALGHGLPNCAGVALGIDRLLMAMQGAESISEVLAFPSDRS